MIFRFKIFLLTAVVPIFLLIFFNLFFLNFIDKNEKIYSKNKNLKVLQDFSIILKESYLKGDFFDVDKYLSFLKKTHLNIYYINLFDEKGNICYSTYKNKHKYKTKIIYFSSSDLNLDNDFFSIKEFILDRNLQKSNVLYKDLFLLDRQKIKEYTYFFTLNKKIIANIKIGFLIEDITLLQKFLKTIKSFPIFKYSLYTFFFILILEIIISELIANLFLIFKEAINMIINNKFGIDIKINRFFRKSLSELTNNLKHLEEKFIELGTLKKNFVANVTHELRSPLGIIESYLKLMIDEDIEKGFKCDENFYKKIDHKERHFYFLRLLENTKRLKKFVNDVLDISKIESNKIVLNKENVCLKDLLYSIKDFFSIKLKEHNINLNINIDKNINFLYLDKEKIHHLFIILIDNAIKFSYKNSTIEINAKILFNNNKKNIHSILIEVADNGIGIEQENLKTVFEEFEQIKNFDKNISVSEKGTGLGLFIAKNIVELHGGIIWVESDFGKGSHFFIRIPAIFAKN